MASSSITTCAKSVVCFTGSVRRRMTSRICNVIFEAPFSSCCLNIFHTHPDLKYSNICASKTDSLSSVINFKALRGSCLKSSSCRSLSIKSTVNHRRVKKACTDNLWGSQNMNLHLLMPKQTIVPHVRQNVGTSWSQRCSTAGLFIALFVCYSTSQPVHAEAPDPKDKKDVCDLSSQGYSHGKKVYTDYSVIGIPGDGRCLFRSVAHGACIRSGKPAPNETAQRELADQLRARVADEFVKRREETEWFIEGDFDTYVSQIRKPHVWGGEPELLMASHVLQMPIIVYMHDQDSGGLISIAEYGQEYGKDNPIRVLYHGFGHYDALQVPGKKESRSRL